MQKIVIITSDKGEVRRIWEENRLKEGVATEIILQYPRALIGTLSLMILVAIGVITLNLSPLFSFTWFIGAIDITGSFIIIFYISYKFIGYEEKENKRLKQK